MSQDLPVPLPELPAPNPPHSAFRTIYSAPQIQSYATAYARACMAPLQEELDAAWAENEMVVRLFKELTQRAESAEAELSRLKAQEPVALEAKQYVCQVPDQCDRITWRGQYYGLPIAAPPSQEQPINAAAQEPVAWEWFTQDGEHRLTLVAPADYELPIRVTPLYAAPPSQEPVAFHWLVELFHRGGNSIGRYHTGLTDLHGASRSTADVYQAVRYTSKQAAQKAADKLNVMMKAAEWRAVEHGFHASQPAPSQEQT